MNQLIGGDGNAQRICLYQAIISAGKHDESTKYRVNFCLLVPRQIFTCCASIDLTSSLTCPNPDTKAGSTF